MQDGTTDVTLLDVLETEEMEPSAREDALQPVADMMTAEGMGAGLIPLEAVTSDDSRGTIAERPAD